MSYKGSIPNQVSIDDRPSVVEGKTQIGNWEVDLMMGGHSGGGLLTLVERKSRFTGPTEKRAWISNIDRDISTRKVLNTKRPLQS
jgi:IS30 family transposase